MTRKRAILGAGVIVLIIVGMVWAQDQQGGRRGGAQGGRQGGRPQGGRQGGPGGRGGPGGFDPARMQQMMADRMKDQLGASDDEWKIIGPRLTKVMTLSRQSRGGGMMGMMGMFSGRGRGGPGGGRGGDRGGDRGGRPDRELTGVAKVTSELRTLLDGNPSADQIKAKLTALRQAREKSKQDLAKAQQSLKQVLSLKQEAQLVLIDVLP